jgi:hypothetical protein
MKCSLFFAALFLSASTIGFSKDERKFFTETLDLEELWRTHRLITCVPLKNDPLYFKSAIEHIIESGFEVEFDNEDNIFLNLRHFKSSEIAIKYIVENGFEMAFDSEDNIFFQKISPSKTELISLFNKHGMPNEAIVRKYEADFIKKYNIEANKFLNG